MAFDDEGGVWQLRQDPISGIVEKVRVPENIEPEPEEPKQEKKKRRKKSLNTSFICEDDLALLEDLE